MCQAQTQFHTTGPRGCAQNFKAVREIWEPLIQQRRIVDPSLMVMVELSEDESGILPKVEYWREKDSILGSCGIRSATHKCNDEFHPVIGNSWDRLVDIISKAVPSPYLRIIMLNPLVDWLPAMTVLANATCNKFDHVPHVSDQWVTTRKYFDRELRPIGCLLKGRGSDGDARRYKLQHEQYMQAFERLQLLRRMASVIQRRWRRSKSLSYVVAQVIRRRPSSTDDDDNGNDDELPELVEVDDSDDDSDGDSDDELSDPAQDDDSDEVNHFTLPLSLEGAKGFTFACTATYRTDTGKMVDIAGLPSQDTKHKGKRIDAPLQSAAKTMILGRYVASAIDLFLVRNYFDDEQVRNLRTSDLRRDDRQNFAAVVRRSGKLVIAILELLQHGTNGGHDTQGTVEVYKMLSMYLLIFFSVKATLADRVQYAGFVCQFLRLWHVSIRF